MISPNVKLSYRRIQSSEEPVFSVSCSLSARLVPVTNKFSSSPTPHACRVHCIYFYLYIYVLFEIPTMSDRLFKYNFSISF
ncbi:BgTH12-06107 [Blumeria graminis f. sp. triticale]|uniref:BgTH12-06107 n=1 Tax=Blumeria graminis f. sp. triticale TaxID=1689686 RepID=A0A9W4D5B4_BLUGR|nr:BgTH12-06107 [Blumeria graminis f. sp. triticale]